LDPTASVTESLIVALASDAVNISIGLSNPQFLTRWGTNALSLTGPYKFMDRGHFNGRLSHSGSYGQTLPTTQIYDGELAMLTNSVTMPDYSWRMRYNAMSQRSYHWEFIGGSKMMKSDNTEYQLPNAASGWAGPTTSSITLPWVGIYEITVTQMLFSEGTFTFAWSLQDNAKANSENPHVNGQTFPPAINQAALYTYFRDTATIVFTATSVNTLVNLKFQSNSAAAGGVVSTNRMISVLPVRLL